MWRDPYGASGWGERVFAGLLSLLVAAILLGVLATLVQPLIPALMAAVVVAGLLLWLRHHLYR